MLEDWTRDDRVSPIAPDAYDNLNVNCFCVTTDVAALQTLLQEALHDTPAAQPITVSHPHLCSPMAVFVSPASLAGMQAVFKTRKPGKSPPEYAARGAAAP